MSHSCPGSKDIPTEKQTKRLTKRMAIRKTFRPKEYKRQAGKISIRKTSQPKDTVIDKQKP